MNQCLNCIHFRELPRERWYCAEKNLRFSTFADAIGCLDDFESRPLTFKARKDIPYEQINNPIQITHAIIPPGGLYEEPTGLLTVLFQDGTIVQGRTDVRYGEEWTWEKIKVPPIKDIK